MTSTVISIQVVQPGSLFTSQEGATAEEVILPCSYIVHKMVYHSIANSHWITDKPTNSTSVSNVSQHSRSLSISPLNTVKHYIVTLASIQNCHGAVTDFSATPACVVGFVQDIRCLLFSFTYYTLLIVVCC